MPMNHCFRLLRFTLTFPSKRGCSQFLRMCGQPLHPIRVTVRRKPIKTELDVPLGPESPASSSYFSRQRAAEDETLRVVTDGNRRSVVGNGNSWDQIFGSKLQ